MPNWLEHLNIPTPEEMYELRRGKPISKGPSRLTDRKAESREAKQKDEAFRREVFKRDHGRCRCCGRKVVKTLARVVERAEVHHLHGRLGTLRYLVRAAILLCCECHERVTGRVGDRLQVVGTAWFTHEGQRLIDAKKPVHFRKVA